MTCNRTMVPLKFLTIFSTFQRLVGLYNLWIFPRDQETSVDFSTFLVSFCFAWVTSNPLNGQILYNKCLPLIVPRFSFFIEDFVGGNDDISKTWSRGPCDFVNSVRKLLQ